jgi:hypothetical protein
MVNTGNAVAAAVIMVTAAAGVMISSITLGLLTVALAAVVTLPLVVIVVILQLLIPFAGKRLATLRTVVSMGVDGHGRQHTDDHDKGQQPACQPFHSLFLHGCCFLLLEGVVFATQ